MARLPYLSLDQAPEQARRLLSKLPPLHIFATLAHSPMALRGFVQMGSGLLYEGALDAALREAVILRVGHLCGSAYEVAQHEDAARQLGVDPARIEATRQPVAASGDVFDAPTRAALRYTEEVVAQVKASEQAWEGLLPHFSEAALVELTLTVGYYMMVARLLENLEVELEPPGTQGLDFSGES